MSLSNERFQHEFTYTRRDYAFDVGCLVGFFCLWFYVGAKLITNLQAHPPAALFWYGFPVALFMAAVAADFLSGFVHFVADNFFTPDTPVVGRSFIQPFREHHDLPMKITEHSFAELNGNSAFLCLPILLFFAYRADGIHSTAYQLFVLFILLFTVLVVITNKIHFWAHARTRPPLIAALQRHNLILSPKHHSLHHTFPYEGNYCITLGLLNPLLDRLGFFDAFKRTVRRFSKQR